MWNYLKLFFKPYSKITFFFLGISQLLIIQVAKGQQPDLTPYHNTPDKINYLRNEISRLGRSGKFLEVIRYAQVGISLSRKAKIDSARAEFTYFMASAYSAQSLTDSSLHYFHKAAQVAPTGSTIQLRTWIQLIYTYNLMGKQDSAYSVLSAAKKVASRVKSTKILGDLEVLEANLLNDGGKFTQSLQAYIRAYQYYQQEKDTSEMASALEGVSLVQNSLANYPKSLAYIQEARTLFFKMQNLDRVANCELTMADLFITLNQTDSAKRYYQQVIDYGKTIEDNYIVGKAYHGLATIAEKQGKTDQAESYLKQSLAIIEKTDIKPTIARTQQALGELYVKNQQYELAKKYLESALANQQESERSVDIINTYLLLAKTHAALKNYTQAYYFQNLYSIERDTLQKKESAKALAEVESQYQVDRKQQEIALLNEKNRSQSLELAVQRRNVFLLIAGLLLSGVAATVGYRRYRFRKRLEMERIRNRIAADFHDELGANLSSIALYSDLLLKNQTAEKERTLPLLENISQQAHGSISSINDLIWTIKPDNDVLERTIVRMKEFANPLLESRNIRFVFVADDSLSQALLDMNIRKFLYLIFKEAINNVVKYAKATSVTVQLRESKGMISMEIADDGIGFDPGNVRRGNGLNNMQARASELGGKLVIDSQSGQGTRIRLSFKASS
ncbi:sensor histidine kinase [Cytophagaceae bacterium YF14B1]|uniref:histidine kinase n=1 Tax=Xanthocytophaga flava TaxID=3048013 RepID=A0AAE3QNG5_9BACT|nr:sensor histidine kinase [Xanthocytophaga flavus]